MKRGLLSARDLSIDALKAYAEGVPSFRADSYTAQLATNAEAGTVVATISAANANDRAALSYAFTRDGNLSNLFAIDGRTGVITLNTALPPFAAATSYILKVQATNGTYTSTEKVTVNIGDVSQPSEGDTPTPTPVVPDASDGLKFIQTDYTVIVEEDTARNALLVKLLISDPNNLAKNWTPRIDSNSDGVFISGEEGIFGISRLQYDSPNGHQIDEYRLILKKDELGL